eukprot:scaffold37161_cov48-Phaeocystis_antarctica.AAC.1
MLGLSAWSCIIARGYASLRALMHAFGGGFVVGSPQQPPPDGSGRARRASRARSYFIGYGHKSVSK